MDKKTLLTAAQRLQPVSESTFAEYRDNTDQLINRINKLMMTRSDLEHLIGSNNTQMMKDNHANHVRFMTSIMKEFNAEVLVDTVFWVFRAYRSHGFAQNYWAAQLNGWIEILKETLSPESYQEVYPYYEWMQINIPAFVSLSDEKLDASNALH